MALVLLLLAGPATARQKHRAPAKKSSPKSKKKAPEAPRLPHDGKEKTAMA
jgi:hypothetical protein